MVAQTEAAAAVEKVQQPPAYWRLHGLQAQMPAAFLFTAVLPQWGQRYLFKPGLNLRFFFQHSQECSAKKNRADTSAEKNKIEEIWENAQ